MPKVSIVLPTYNGEKYLKESIDSILYQTYKDWELIIVDDCSTDRTSDIVEKYAKCDSRIHAIHNIKNQKLPYSLNIGFSKAKGDYLTWTSDDNLYMSDAIEVMTTYLDTHDDVYMVQGDADVIDEIGEVIGQFGIYSGSKMCINNCVGACFMYRKEVRETIGDYNVDFFCVEDYEYWLRVLENFGEIISIHKTLYKYRVHKKSLTYVKAKEVNDQLTRLRIKNIDKIIKLLCNDKKELCNIYYEMKKSKYMTSNIMKKFLRVIPELQGELPYIKHKKYIIFGAGKYGENAAKVLGEKAVYFADSNPNKVGKIKCGLEILYIREAIKLEKDYCFIIAISSENIYEMMVQLQEAGVKEYAVYQ